MEKMLSIAVLIVSIIMVYLTYPSKKYKTLEEETLYFSEECYEDDDDYEID